VRSLTSCAAQEAVDKGQPAARQIFRVEELFEAGHALVVTSNTEDKKHSPAAGTRRATGYQLCNSCTHHTNRRQHAEKEQSMIAWQLPLVPAGQNQQYMVWNILRNKGTHLRMSMLLHLWLLLLL
jgi:hypothetical protein